MGDIIVPCGCTCGSQVECFFFFFLVVILLVWVILLFLVGGRVCFRLNVVFSSFSMLWVNWYG